MPSRGTIFHMLTTILLFVACGAQNATADASAPEAPEPTSAAKAPALLVSGTIAAPAELPEAKAIYVVLRAKGVPGPPLAAKKYAVGPFPLSFELTEADRPMVRGPVPDAVQLKVTVDVDGNPMSKSDGDLVVVMDVNKGTSDLSVAVAPR